MPLLLLLLLLLPLSLPSAAAVAATIPSFREAPAFRNAPECASPTTHNIHIAMTLDCTYLRGSLAAVFSILHHSSCPQNISFHFLSTPSDHPFLSATLSDTFPFLPFSLHLFDPHLVLTKISSSLRPALDHPLNYARIYLPQLLPLSLPRVIYLDSDLVLLDDIANLWSINLNSHVLGAPEYCHANFTRYFTLRFWSNPQFSRVFHDRKRHPCYFNTGVMVIDLVKWREGKYTERLEGWMILRKRHKIYQLGSLPPFLLVFSGAVEPVAHRWNQHGLGGDNLRGLCRPLHPGPVSLLHWSGKGKPWLRIDAGKPCPLDSLWAPYDLVYRPPSLISDSN